MKLLRLDLDEHRGNKNNAKYRRADEIALACRRIGSFAQPGHGNGVTAGLAQRSSENLNDPEYQRYLRYFCGKVLFVHFCPLPVNFAMDDEATGSFR